MSLRRLLDTFCGAGGCAMGYHRAGFEVVGVDIAPQPRYPFPFILGDTLDVLARLMVGDAIQASDGQWYTLDDFLVIGASPPCQAHSATKAWWQDREHPDLVGKTRKVLKETGKPYVIENVPGAPLENYVILCGTMFGLYVIRHRWFECKPSILMAPFTCNHDRPVVRCGLRPERWKQFASVVGHHSDVKYSAMAMGIPPGQMTQSELAQAIPPAYTEWLGKQLLEVLNDTI